MTEAFGTIKRTKLMEILESFLRQDKVRFIRMLFSNTILDIKSSSNCNNIFHTNIDCWQGQFSIYISMIPKQNIQYWKEVKKNKEWRSTKKLDSLMSDQEDILVENSSQQQSFVTW